MLKAHRGTRLVSQDVDRSWHWLLGLGILFVILGCIGCSMVVGLTLVSLFFLGVLFIIAGVSQLIDAFKSRLWKGVFLHTAIALLYLFGGALVIYDPILASAILTALLAWILIFMGLMRFFMAITLAGTKEWGWLLVSGLTSFILGVLILVQWPISALWVIGLFIAIELMVNGWVYIFMAFSMYRSRY